MSKAFCRPERTALCFFIPVFRFCLDIGICKIIFIETVGHLVEVSYQVEVDVFYRRSSDPFLDNRNVYGFSVDEVCDVLLNVTVGLYLIPAHASHGGDFFLAQKPLGFRTAYNLVVIFRVSVLHIAVAVGVGIYGLTFDLFRGFYQIGCSRLRVSCCRGNRATDELILNPNLIILNLITACCVAVVLDIEGKGSVPIVRSLDLGIDGAVIIGKSINLILVQTEVIVLRCSLIFLTYCIYKVSLTA